MVDIAKLASLRADLATAEAARDRHRAIFESAVDFAIIVIDRNGDVTDWNSGAERVFGWTAAEMRGGGIDRIFTATDRVTDHPGQEMRHALSAGRASDERWHLRQDGSIFWASGEMMPLRAANGAHLGYIKILRDRTDQRRAEDALKRLNQSLEHQVAARTRERDRAWTLSRDLLSVAESDGRLVAVNTAWTRVLGWPETALIGNPYADFIHPDDLAATRAAFGRMIEAPLTTPHEFRLRHRDDGYRWFSWTGAFDDGLIYASGRHISAEREQAAALRQTEAQLRQSQKMEAVGQLTGGIAHDFNNLLSGITGSLELLALRLEQGRIDELDRHIAAAEDAARRAAGLTNRLLAFSRRQPLDPKPIDVNALVGGMEDLIRRAMGARVAVEINAAADIWTALIDPHQLENALLNLCINARDAMPDGGRLIITTENAVLERSEPDLPSGAYLSLAVTDTGTGMGEHVIRHAFEPFFTTKPSGQGTGLGLAMVYGFARQSGGLARIESHVGRGTTLRLYMPQHHGPAEWRPDFSRPARNR
jgi:PAS domain S-box-containing protein